MNDLHTKSTDDQLLEQASRLLREDASRMDGATQSRLNQARNSALEELGSGSVIRQWMPGRPVVALAGSCAAVLIAVTLIYSPGPEDGGAATVATEDIDLLLAGESLEMIEDLEFYQWLDDPDGSAVLLADPDNMG